MSGEVGDGAAAELEPAENADADRAPVAPVTARPYLDAEALDVAADIPPAEQETDKLDDAPAPMAEPGVAASVSASEPALSASAAPEPPLPETLRLAPDEPFAPELEPLERAPVIEIEPADDGAMAALRAAGDVTAAGTRSAVDVAMFEIPQADDVAGEAVQPDQASDPPPAAASAAGIGSALQRRARRGGLPRRRRVRRWITAAPQARAAQIAEAEPALPLAPAPHPLDPEPRSAAMEMRPAPASDGAPLAPASNVGGVEPGREAPAFLSDAPAPLPQAPAFDPGPSADQPVPVREQMDLAPTKDQVFTFDRPEELSETGAVIADAAAVPRLGADASWPALAADDALAPQPRPAVPFDVGRLALLVARSAFAAARIAVIVVAGLMLLGVAAYRVVEPPLTFTMAQRALAGAELRRSPAPLERISPHLVRAVIAAEDSRFCAHNGFDRREIARALADARNGGRLRGASTLSQQTAKNAFLWTGGGWPRKAAEAGLTGLIELTWTKRRILEVYLNAAEWGDGLFGAEAAAQARFGISAADLSPRQAALLAAVLPSPNAWRLDPPSEGVSSRAATIEARMRIVERDGLADCVLSTG